MSIEVKLRHRTAYRYERDVALGPQVIQLRPAPHCKTPITDYVLKLTPTITFCTGSSIHWGIIWRA